jgi:DNA-binding protein HU-beta
MTKRELALTVAIKTGYTSKAILEVLEATMDSIKVAVRQGDDVQIRGFGCFKRKHRAPKHARRIYTNESMIIPEHDEPFFKPYDEFKELVLNPKEIKTK